MIKIVRHGDLVKIKQLEQTKIFVCDYCYCQFEASKDDYMIHWNEYCPSQIIFSCKCPDCNQIAIIEERNY